MPVVAASAFATVGDASDFVRSLLNDADIPSTASITATGASRTANVVTITTLAAHGFLVGDRVQVSGITDSSFNGTQTIASVPTTTTFTYNQTGANASSGNGLVQLLSPGDTFSDTVLLPFIRAGYRKTQRALSTGGAKSMTSDVDLVLKAGDLFLGDTISGAGSNALPSDLLAPRELLERQSGTANRFVRMVGPLDELPDVPQTTKLAIWSWREDNIYFVGSTLDTDIRLRYFRGLATLGDRSSQLMIRGGLDAISYWAASLAVQSRGAAGAAQFVTLYGDAMSDLQSLDAHARQYIPSRRRPYGGRYRGRGYRGGAWL